MKMAFRQKGLCRLIVLVLTLCMLGGTVSAALSESQRTEEQIDEESKKAYDEAKLQSEKEIAFTIAATLGQYLSDLMVRIETLYNEKFASLRTRFSVSGYENTLLSCDPDRLEEVIQNVLENAIKYGDGRWVRIDFDDEEDCRLITVTNSGCSIKEEEIPHLFESFYRGSNSTKVNGSGLGLYIARSLMRMMDGDIFAKCLPSKEEKSAGDFAVTIVVRKA